METQNIVSLLKISDNEFSKFSTKSSTLLAVNQMVVIHITIQ